MGSLGTVLVLLGRFWALYSTTGLSVFQDPEMKTVAPGSNVNFTCSVAHAQNPEILWVKWTRDQVDLCSFRVNYSSVSNKTCSPQCRLSWEPSGKSELQLNHVSTKDSGCYICHVTLEIPSLEEVKGNGTQLHVEELHVEETGLHSMLLVVGMVAVIVVVLGIAAYTWNRCFCRRSLSRNLPEENPLYSNVPYRPRHTQKKITDWPAEGKVLEGPQEDKKVKGVYATSLPRSTTPQQRLLPKNCLSPKPKIKHPVFAAGASAGKSASRGFLEADGN